METKYDFGSIIDRAGTHAVKTDALVDTFGRGDVTPLWVADMDFAVCPAITEALTQRLESNRIYGYTVPIANYWQSIIDWQRERNGFEFGVDEMCYVPGIVTGFGLALNHFTQPGDKVIIQEPVYHPFRISIEGNGRIAVNNALRETADGYYEMDIVNLEQIMAEERPKMMVLCNPHNPIGIAWPDDVLRRVAQLARRYGVLVFSDEIHGDLMMNGNRHTPFATVSDDAAAVAITMGAPSKTFNIPGVVSSWCVVKNPQLREPFFKWLDVNGLNHPNFIAMTATEAAYRHGAEWLERCLCYIEGNIDLVVDYCERHIDGIRAIRPQASYLVWLDCRGLGLTREQVVDLFVNKARLGLNDGAMFGHGGECFMRLNVGSPRSVIEDALKRLDEAVKSLK